MRLLFVLFSFGTDLPMSQCTKEQRAHEQAKWNDIEQSLDFWMLVLSTMHIPRIHVSYCALSFSVHVWRFQQRCWMSQQPQKTASKINQNADYYPLTWVRRFFSHRPAEIAKIIRPTLLIHLSNRYRFHYSTKHIYSSVQQRSLRLLDQ